MEKVNKAKQVIKNEEVINEAAESKAPENKVIENFENLFYYGQAKQAVRNYLGKTLDEYNIYDAFYNKKDKKHFENFYLKSSKNPKDLLKITFLNRKLFRIDVIKKEKEGKIEVVMKDILFYHIIYFHLYNAFKKPFLKIPSVSF